MRDCLNGLGFYGAVIALALLLPSSAVHADVFRCTGTDGKTVYQATPCAAGTQKALDDRESRARERASDAKKAESDQNQKKWLKCEEKKNCDDVCFGTGDTLATVFIANFSNMVDTGTMASRMMKDGCEEQVGPKGASCVSMCISGFKVKARTFLK